MAAVRRPPFAPEKCRQQPLRLIAPERAAGRQRVPAEPGHARDGLGIDRDRDGKLGAVRKMLHMKRMFGKSGILRLKRAKDPEAVECQRLDLRREVTRIASLL